MPTTCWIVLLLSALPVACRAPGPARADEGAAASTSSTSIEDPSARGGPEAARPLASESVSPPASGNPGPAPEAKQQSASPAVRPIDPTPAPNRDKHGNANVEKYIATLQSDQRIADLQVDVVVAKLALPPDAVVGDLGCGPGVFVSAFSKACPDGIVYASDVEPRQLDAVRERIHEQKLTNVVPVLASYDDPHFPPERLDVVFIGDTYHHLEDRVVYMQRLARVLRPGGRIVLLDYKPGKLPVGPGPEHKLEAGVMEKEMAAAGYKRVASFDTHPYQDFEIWRVVQDWEKK